MIQITKKRNRKAVRLPVVFLLTTSICFAVHTSCTAWIVIHPLSSSSPSRRSSSPSASSSPLLLHVSFNENPPPPVSARSYWDDAGVQIAQAIQPHVVLVSPKGVRNMTARGSGFVLHHRELKNVDSWDPFSPTTADVAVYIVTAAHVTPPGYTVQVSWPLSRASSNNTHQNVPATVVARNLTMDLALLQVVLPVVLVPLIDDFSRENVTMPETTTSTTTGVAGSTTSSTTTTSRPAGAGLFLSTDLPPVGTLVYSHGYPASRLRGPAMTSGIVCGIADGVGVPKEDDDEDNNNNNNRNDNNMENTPQRRQQRQQQRQQQSSQEIPDRTVFVVTNAAMSGGMSGGPLVDSSGYVVGVNALIRPDLRALGNYAVSSWELRKFLQDWVVASTRTITSGSRTSATTPDERKSQDSALGDSDSRNKTCDAVIWLYNDGMNKKERVASILETIAGLNVTTAQRVMMEAHTTGRGLVGNYTCVESAVSMGQALRDQDLLVEWEAVPGQ